MSAKGISLLGNQSAKGFLKALFGVKSAHDPASITSPNDNDTTLTVTGARLGDFVIVAPVTSIPAGGAIVGWVSATDTVTIRFIGIVGTVDSTSQDFNVLVLGNRD